MPLNPQLRLYKSLATITKMKNKMNKIYLLIGLIFINSCSPKLSSIIKNDFTQIRNDIEKIEVISDTRDYEIEYPKFNFYQTKIPVSEIKTKIEKSTLKLKINEISEIIQNDDNSCGFIKVVGKDNGTLLRVKYIYLKDQSENGELAKKVLSEYKNGKSFSSLAIKYGKDGNGKKGGDLGWMQKSMLVSDFVNAVSEHKLNAVFITNTDAFGWYVIEKTHNIAKGNYLEIIKVKRKVNCR